MVLGPERLRTINLSVENSTDFKHLSPAEGKKHQSLYSTRPLPHPKTWGNNGELRAWLQGKIQTGCETKAMEGTNRNKAEFNREKGVGNCKRKREKKKEREVAGNKESSWRQAAVVGPSPSAFPAAGVQGCRGERGLLCPRHQRWEQEGPQPQLHPWRQRQACSADRDSWEKDPTGSDGTGSSREKQ